MNKNNWTYKKLGEVAIIKAGYTPPSSDLMDCGNIPYFKVGDMNNLGNEKYLQYSSSYVNDNFKSFPQASIVFPKNGAAIATNKKRILKQSSVVDLNTAVLIPNKKESVEFLYYWICNVDFKDITRRGAVPTLDTKTLMKLDVPYITLAEQERIVAELDLLSSIIEKKKAQLKELDQLAQSIFYDMFGDPITNEKGWENSCFGSIMTPAKSNKCKSHSELPILSITMHDGIVRQRERFKKVIASKDVTGYKIIKRGQLVIAFPIDEGLIYTQDIEDEGIMSPAYNVWDVDYSKVNTIFLKFHLHSPAIMKYYKDKLRGTTLRRRMIPKEDLLNLPIPLPPLPLQQEFASKVEAIERQKSLIQQSIDEVQTLFDSRMDYWFG